jgi:uncharacterized protein
LNEVLLDTGCIVALLDRSEKHHERCVEALDALVGPLVTCEAVIAEACYLLRRHRGAVDAVLENVERGVFRIPLRLDDGCAAVRALMRRYARVPMDLADGCLVAMADSLGTGRVLTLDGDFHVYRWRRTRTFQLLIDVEAE